MARNIQTEKIDVFLETLTCATVDLKEKRFVIPKKKVNLWLEFALFEG